MFSITKNLTVLFFVFFPTSLWGQSAQRFWELGDTAWEKADYENAETLYLKAVSAAESTNRRPREWLAGPLTSLARVQQTLAKFETAEQTFLRIIAITEQTTNQSASRNLSIALNNLGAMYSDMLRFDDADKFLRRALSVRQRLRGTPNALGLSSPCSNIGRNYHFQHRFIDADIWLSYSLLLAEREFGHNSPRLCSILGQLGHLFLRQSRYEKAEAHFTRMKQILSSSNPRDPVMYASALTGLAGIQYWSHKNADRANDLWKQALAVQTKHLGPDHPYVAETLQSLAYSHCFEKAAFIEAEAELLRAEEIWIKLHGLNSRRFCVVALQRAGLNLEQENFAQTETTANHVIGLLEPTASPPGVAYDAYRLRGRARYALGKKDEAFADLAVALEFAEKRRTGLSGGAIGRAAGFSENKAGYENLLKWQVDATDIAGAFRTMERSRARSLQDQLLLQNVDPLQGAKSDDAKGLKETLRHVETKIAGLERRIDALPSDKNRKGESDIRRKQLIAELHAARGAYADTFARIRDISPAYRLALGRDQKPVEFSKIADRIKKDNALYLEYFFGEDASYVLAITPLREAVIHTLDMTDASAKLFGVEGGPLTFEKLQHIVVGDDVQGVQALLRRSDEPTNRVKADERLAALWTLLVPEACQDDITSGLYSRLMVIPDGALTSLPLEAFVIENGESPTYLIDVSPPITYSPSATVAFNLAQREASDTEGREPVLSVGNPVYGQSGSQTGTTRSAAGARYSRLGGTLRALPFSELEMKWVSEVFSKQDLDVGMISQTAATEKRIVSSIPGRRIVHLACHGLVDPLHGNLFGSLAVTPGKSNIASDDGFLSLAEIYDLDMSSCELTILSACDTNYGPHQRGEGVWALSRGFLVAGSRRVVASNWYVDDRAAANLVSYFCSGIALKENSSADYAGALHAAKKWVRNQEKWSSPYYWATFVLVGPG